MHHRGAVISGECAFECILVSDISLDDDDGLTANLLYPLKSFATAV
jgi:hypothetical protein